MHSKPTISTSTQLCAVMGDPIAHSLSPAIHNAGFNALNLDFVFVAFRVTDVERALHGMRALDNFRGLSVTIPHKIAAMAFVDTIDPLHKIAGSINTIVNTQGALHGTSTDGLGALQALLEAGSSPDHCHILLLGAGGAARSLCFTLLDQTRPASLTITDLDPKTCQTLANDLKTQFRCPIYVNPAIDVAQYDLIINTTPVGMAPKIDHSPLAGAVFGAGQTVFDVVYTPLKTRLLREAEAAGATVITGAEMFIHQAALQFKLYTGSPAPIDVMRSTLMEKLQK